MISVVSDKTPETFLSLAGKFTLNEYLNMRRCIVKGKSAQVSLFATALGILGILGPSPLEMLSVSKVKVYVVYVLFNSIPNKK